jgi:hypothetical protein
MLLSGILVQWTQPFATVNSVILLQWTHSFCYCELSHFAKVNSTIFTTLLSYFVILSAILIDWTQLFCNFVSHFAIVNPAIICYSELSYFSTMLSHFMILSAILEIMWVIFAVVLSHFTKLLGHSRDSISHSLEWLTWGAGVRCGSVARSGTHGSIGGGSRLNLLGMRDRAAWGEGGVVWCAPGSVSGLDCWV